jgi:hypothetical protein
MKIDPDEKLIAIVTISAIGAIVLCVVCATIVFILSI